TVTNSGNITLAGPFSINDDKEGTIACGSGSLAPGGTTTCTATHTTVLADLNAGSIVNTRSEERRARTANKASKTAKPVQTPGLTLVKPATTLTYSAVGNVITYTYTVTNSGNVTLAGPFSITDDKLGTIACGTASLAPGGTTTCTKTYTIVLADLNAGSIVNT